MKRNGLIIVLVLALVATGLTGCASIGQFPAASVTKVELAGKNYEMAKINATGRSFGFNLLGIIPIVPTRYDDAMGDLYSRNVVDPKNKALALTNVTQEKSCLYLILFSIPRLTVRADIVEFTK